VAKSGQVHVVFASPTGVVYATRSTAGTWTNLVVDGGGASPSLALDGKGRPYLAYFNGHDLFVAQPTGSSAFVLTPITTVSLNDVGPLVTVAPSGRVHIAFRDGHASGCPAADAGIPALAAFSPWDRLPPRGASPVGRFWFSIAYDGRRHRAYIFGGTNGLESANDVWEWNADDGSWKDRTPAGGGPPALQTGDPLASAAYDEVRDRVVVASGGTWEWNPKTGAFTPAIPDRPQALSYDRARQKVVAVGSNGALVDWQPSSTQWVEARAVGAALPPAQNLISVSDPDRKRVLFFFGAGDPSTPGTSSIQTWEWNGGKRRWTDLTPLSGIKPPLLLTGAAYASRGRVLMFGGEVGRPPATWAYNSSDQTWIWNTASGSWAQPPVRGPVPPMRVNQGMVFDSAHEVVLMFGGRSEPVMPNARAILDDLWRWTAP
jgi:hypothetical protein